MVELEREFTFLLSKLPDDIHNFPSKVITKKQHMAVIDGIHADSSHMSEHTIELSNGEHGALLMHEGKTFVIGEEFYEV